MREYLLFSALALIVTGSFHATQWHSTSYGAASLMTRTDPQPSNPATFDNLTVEAIYLSDKMIRVRVKPSMLKPGQEEPYVVPDVVIPGNSAPANATSKAGRQLQFTLGVAFPSGSESFLFVNDPSGQPVLELRDVVFDQQQISFTTPYASTEFLYGYGEHDYYYFINKNTNVTLSLWNTDNGTPWQKPMYGVHPVTFHSDPVLKRHYATFLANSHAQNLHIGSDGTLKYTAVGGIIDLYVILDDTPLGVLQQYHALIGPSAVPPYWALGTHQCRWGYKNLSMVEGVVQGYAEAGIPLEVMWNDIDYMDRFRVFTTDPERYPLGALRQFIDGLHAKNMRYVQITDPGVAQAMNYSVYSSGMDSQAFVMTQDGGKPLVNAVWPGWTVFPDFTAAGPSQWWASQIALYRSNVPVDGMWLDMNELGTFCAGQCDVAVGTNWSVDWKTVNWNTFTEDICMPNNCTVVNSTLNYPPINPLNNGYQLFNKTLDMTGKLALGSYYQTKAFYGLMEEKASYDALLAQTGTRPFLLSRASYAGSGRFTAHWTGDNNAAWEQGTGGIYDSIQAVLGANLWGIPMVGADIGGFGGTTTEELIVRWYQLGCFYTFTRNHHDLQGPGQEPYLFSAAAQSAIKDAIARKYRLLPYFFTQLVKAHYNEGPVLRHLSLQFPNDAKTYVENTQFMVGDSLLVTPIVAQGQNATSAYIPEGCWYNFDSGRVIVTNGGMWIVLISELYDPIAAMSPGGSVIPVHETPGMTVTETQASGVGVRVFMSTDNTAAGSLLLASDAPLETQNVTSLTYSASGTLASGTLIALGNASRGRESLTSRVTVDIFFPVRVQVPLNATVSVVVNGNNIDVLNGVTVTDASLSLQLPLGIDGSTLFEVSWAVSGLGQAAGDNTSKKAAIIGGSLGAAAVVVFALAIVMWRKREAHNIEPQYTPLA